MNVPGLEGRAGGRGSPWLVLAEREPHVRGGCGRPPCAAGAAAGSDVTGETGQPRAASASQPPSPSGPCGRPPGTRPHLLPSPQQPTRGGSRVTGTRPASARGQRVTLSALRPPRGSVNNTSRRKRSSVPAVTRAPAAALPRCLTLGAVVASCRSEASVTAGLPQAFQPHSVTAGGRRVCVLPSLPAAHQDLGRRAKWP